MQHLRLRSVVALCLTLIAIAAIRPPPVNCNEADTAAGSLCHSLARFSQRLFASAVSEQPSATSESCLLSPLSVFTDLAMTWMGARGKTAAEIHHTLQIDGLTRSKFAVRIRALLRPLQQSAANSSASALLVANRIYVNTNSPALLPAFNEATRRSFFASAEQLDFGQSAAAAGVINRYVAEQTKGKIENLLDADSLSADTRMVLINAVYFKSRWQLEFDPKLTSIGPFYVAGDSADTADAQTPTVQVPYMRRTGRMLYADLAELGASAVALPYQADAFRMVVVLPQAGRGELKKLVAALARGDSGLDVSGVRERLDETKVRLALPKFETRFRASLNRALQELGIVTAFGAAADFGGMFDGGHVQISDVVHEAYIKVDESGTEAAAATAIIMTRMFVEEVVVELNRPFLYYIEDARANVIFYGQYAGPQQ